MTAGRWTYKGILYRSQAELKLAHELIERSIQFEHDYQFTPKRKFLLDFAIAPKKIGIEVEGLTQKGGRHQRIEGYMRDCVKYNLALVEGWKILRVPSFWLLCGTYSKEISDFFDNLDKLMQ